MRARDSKPERATTSSRSNDAASALSRSRGTPALALAALGLGTVGVLLARLRAGDRTSGEGLAKDDCVGTANALDAAATGREDEEVATTATASGVAQETRDDASVKDAPMVVKEATTETATTNGETFAAPRAPSPVTAVKPKTRSRSVSSLRPALKLEVESGPSRGATMIASLGVDEFSFGRGQKNRFVVEGAEVSTVHAEVRWDGSSWMMRDMGSLNGTRLNGATISVESRVPGPWEKISHGDVIKLGERSGSPHVSVHFFRDESITKDSALHLHHVVRADGSKGPKSEDRVLVECPLRGNPAVGVFAVFDGHGGHMASERARTLFPEVLARRLAGKVPGPEGVRTLLEEAFIESDETMAVEYEGCTASVVLVWRDIKTGGLMLQAANVGDSSVAIGSAPAPSGKTHDAHYLTPEHKVRHAEEKDRLNKAGAELPPEATRLYGLALSRALGDKFLKDQNVGLIAHPFVTEVIHIEPESREKVLTIASDGIWDVINPAEVYDVLQEGDSCAHTALQRLVASARRRRSVDDISIIMVRLADRPFDD